VADRRLNHNDLDPLERRRVARAVVLISLIAAGFVHWLGVDAEFHEGLPGIALGSPFLLHAERALVLAVGITALLMFAVRGWAGYFPSKITTSGAEYPHRPVDEVLKSGEAVYDEIVDLKKVHKALAEGTHARLDGFEREITTLRAQVDGQRIDDML
jgi:hypothetical protein